MPRQLTESGAPLPIVFSNQHLVAVDKPAGWLSVPSRMGEKDARPCVGIVLQEQLKKRLWPVHRLDEEVSGLLLFACSAEAHRLLCRGFEGHELEKVYAALCEGAPPADLPEGETRRLESKLLRGKRRAYPHPAGKPAITDVTRLPAPPEAKKDTLHFELRPRTGRAHQLRVELSRLGCPILGDSLYGSKQPSPPEYAPGIALRAVALHFTRFADREKLGLPPSLFAPAVTVKSAPPDDAPARPLPTPTPATH